MKRVLLIHARDHSLQRNTPHQLPSHLVLPSLSADHDACKSFSFSLHIIRCDESRLLVVRRKWALEWAWASSEAVQQSVGSGPQNRPRAVGSCEAVRRRWALEYGWARRKLAVRPKWA
jgi:hypothetical protein